MVHIFNRLRNNLFNYTICFDPNGSSSGVFSYTSFTIELQREIHTFLLIYIGHKRLCSFSFTPYLEILTSVGPLYQPNNKLNCFLVYYNLIEN
jgi:hypothetical protein